MSKLLNTIMPLAPFGAAFATTNRAVPGTKLIDLKSLNLIAPIAGGAKGYHAAGDVLTKTADGRDLNDLWSEFQATLAIQNERRQALIDLLTFTVTNIIEDVPQFGGGDFESMSEYGVPQGLRPTTSMLSLGYPFKWYDIALRYTWQFLAEANAAQVEAAHQGVLDADNRNLFMETMRTLFREDNRLANIQGQNYNVYTFWNGDGTPPPPYKNTTFPGTHTHFRTSGAAAVVPADIQEIVDDFKSHGYSAENGTTHFIMVNSVEARVIRQFRVGVSGAEYDFIPAQGQPGLIVPNTQGLLGSQPGNAYRGMNVIGSYGTALIVEEDYIPAGYLSGFASGGAASLQNPIGVREHANAGLRGLKLVKDKSNDYPLIDSYYIRGFGHGVRQRGAGLIMQITANATYTAPAEFAVA